MKRKSELGQAVIEYILIFGFMALIAINLAQALGRSMGGSMGSLGHVMTQHLSVGVCEQHCFYNGFANGGGP
jgi:Flp pilus assembly pilin Flp